MLLGNNTIVANTYGQNWEGSTGRCPTNVHMACDARFLGMLKELPTQFCYMTINYGKYETRSNPDSSIANGMKVWAQCHAHTQFYMALKSKQERMKFFARFLEGLRDL